MMSRRNSCVVLSLSSLNNRYDMCKCGSVFSYTRNKKRSEDNMNDPYRDPAQELKPFYIFKEQFKLNMMYAALILMNNYISYYVGKSLTEDSLKRLKLMREELERYR